jgi:predicted transcriptional regulator
MRGTGVKDNTYFVVQSWMVTDLKLSGNDLIVYAVIYGFSQDGESRFTGSLQYLADWCNATKAGVQKNLKNLIEMGLIEKYESFKNNIKFCEYSCTPYNKVAHPMQQSCINNIDNNIEEDTNFINEISTQPEDDCSSKGYSKEELKEEFLGSVKKSKSRRPTVRRPTLFDKCVVEIDKYTDRPDLREKLIQFLKIRLEVKDKPFGIESWKGMLDKLEQAVRECRRDYTEVVQQSIDKGWLSFYPINQKADKKESVFCDIDMPNTADIKVQKKEGNFSGQTF